MTAKENEQVIDYGEQGTTVKFAQVRQLLWEKGYKNHWEYPQVLLVQTTRKGALEWVYLGTAGWDVWGWSDSEGGDGDTIGNPDTALEVVGIMLAQIADAELTSK